jgi:hypothetical protein
MSSSDKVKREYRLTEASLRTIASHFPAGVLPYEGNEKFWADFANSFDNDEFVSYFHEWVDIDDYPKINR